MGTDSSQRSMWRNSREVLIVSTEESGHTCIIRWQVCGHWSHAALTSLGPTVVRMGFKPPFLLWILWRYISAINSCSLNQLVLTIRWLSENPAMKWGWQCSWPHKEYGDRLTWWVNELSIYHGPKIQLWLKCRPCPRSPRYSLSL